MNPGNTKFIGNSAIIVAAITAFFESKNSFVIKYDGIIINVDNITFKIFISRYAMGMLLVRKVKDSNMEYNG